MPTQRPYFRYGDYVSAFDLPDGWLAGWLGGWEIQHGRPTI